MCCDERSRASFSDALTAFTIRDTCNSEHITPEECCDCAHPGRRRGSQTRALGGGSSRPGTSFSVPSSLNSSNCLKEYLHAKGTSPTVHRSSKLDGLAAHKPHVLLQPRVCLFPAFVTIWK